MNSPLPQSPNPYKLLTIDNPTSTTSPNPWFPSHFPPPPPLTTRSLTIRTTSRISPFIASITQPMNFPSTSPPSHNHSPNHANSPHNHPSNQCQAMPHKFITPSPFCRYLKMTWRTIPSKQDTSPAALKALMRSPLMRAANRRTITSWGEGGGGRRKIRGRERERKEKREIEERKKKRRKKEERRREKKKRKKVRTRRRENRGRKKKEKNEERRQKERVEERRFDVGREWWW